MIVKRIISTSYSILFITCAYLHKYNIVWQNWNSDVKLFMTPPSTSHPQPTPPFISLYKKKNRARRCSTTTSRRRRTRLQVLTRRATINFPSLVDAYDSLTSGASVDTRIVIIFALYFLSSGTGILIMFYLRKIIYIHSMTCLSTLDNCYELDI